jgi:pyruvate/2-oxoglutarate dehydrogenase complex dihydrolipoamide acyltransferase (E2) component
MGMMGIKTFQAIINPPQAMIRPSARARSAPGCWKTAAWASPRR